ncbi:hypothetical protein PSPO01_09679 [Paraphaeosphaeria sporulosa]
MNYVLKTETIDAFMRGLTGQRAIARLVIAEAAEGSLSERKDSSGTQGSLHYRWSGAMYAVVTTMSFYRNPQGGQAPQKRDGAGDVPGAQHFGAREVRPTLLKSAAPPPDKNVKRERSGFFSRSLASGSAAALFRTAVRLLRDRLPSDPTLKSC